MFKFQKTIELSQSVEEVFKYSTNVYNICQMVPGYISVKVLKGSGHLKSGDNIVLNISILGVSFLWESILEDYVENEYFSDKMIRGPFKSWEHKHYFEKCDDNGTILTDIVDYEVPLGGLGYLANTFFVRSMVEQIFTFRHGYDLDDLDSDKSCDI